MSSSTACAIHFGLLAFVVAFHLSYELGEHYAQRPVRAKQLPAFQIPCRPDIPNDHLWWGPELNLPTWPWSSHSSPEMKSQYSIDPETPVGDMAIDGAAIPDFRRVPESETETSDFEPSSAPTNPVPFYRIELGSKHWNQQDSKKSKVWYAF